MRIVSLTFESIKSDGAWKTILRIRSYFVYLGKGLGSRVLELLHIKVSITKSEFRLDLYQTNYSNRQLMQRPFYNVGASSFFHPYWTNIDFISSWYKQDTRYIIHHDLMSNNPLPIDSSAAEIIYTSHTIEHIKEEFVQQFFCEAFRSLKDGGVFRITTGPDAETDFRALMNNDEDWFYWDRKQQRKGSYEHIFRKPATDVPLAERWLHHFASQLAPNDISTSPVKFNASEIYELIQLHGFPKVLDVLCSYTTFDPTRPGNHVSWWTHEKVFEFLKRAGFRTVYRSGYRQSVSPLMRTSELFDSTHPQMSIYVEAIK
jgi:hypothetical protein